MAWNYETSKERVANEWQRLQEAGINVQKLTREMDLSNLSPTEARLVHGVHFYADIHNFKKVLANDLMRRDDFKRVHRYLHVVRVEQRRIMQSVVDGDKIQVQGSKFHGLLYRPYDDDAEIAWRSVLASVAIHLVLERSLPQVFEHYPVLVPTAGLELGDSIVANVGVRGNRELISVGSPANHAAKILGRPGGITVGGSLYTALSKKHRFLFVQDGDRYHLNWNAIDDAEELLADEGIAWSVESSVRNMAATRDSLPLDEILIEEARERVDLANLGPKHAKVCAGAVVFVDVDGYTKLIDGLAAKHDLDELAKAVQLLHLFRYELQKIAESDFDGVVIQHQGDRLQAFVHLPAAADARIKRKIVEIAISCNSSTEEILCKEYKAAGELHVAIGCDFGKALVCRSGVRGDLDAACLGDGAMEAERIQLNMQGNEIGLSPGVFEAISHESVKAAFSHDEGRDAHVARNLTWISLDDKEQAEAYGKSAKAAYASAGNIVLGDRAHEGGRPLKVTRPWHE